jgi:HD-like signal output (HDOD) protein
MRLIVVVAAAGLVVVIALALLRLLRSSAPDAGNAKDATPVKPAAPALARTPGGPGSATEADLAKTAAAIAATAADIVAHAGDTQGANDPAAPAPVAEPPDAPLADAWHTLQEIAFGERPLARSAPPEHAKLVNTVLAALEGATSHSQFLPRRPSIVPELMRAMNQRNSSQREIAKIISHDPAIVADLLKIANSPFYRLSPVPIESVDRAVAILGDEGIRGLIGAAIMQPMFRTPAGAFARFPHIVWDHAYLSGRAAESIAALMENEDPFAAQLLALLLGIGRIVVFRVAADQYKRQPSLKPNAAAIAFMIDKQAAPIARRVATSWDLSDRLITALTEQTAMVETAATHEALERMSPLGRSLYLGNLLGVLALLHRDRRVESEAAKAVALHAGVPGPLLERIWHRIEMAVDEPR